ncbi:hypothetical protein L207DRAFT_543605 [Hyaloscypha variabilis F]|uniref:Uncharacterized protein n=1 Tax=Hyaloscypha variabilis (strain UAMH 11265 / GT02V1 / F) TaxID=1149755 RepID=A0A2J6RSJ0_HYAVF|nr:hypothetical protein L207DRAFT_543605 [Hyaloscypha variabilis F]
MAAAGLDVNYLSAYLSLPQQTLTSVLDSPTTDLVQSVLEAITAKAREYHELAADKLRADIELENAVRSSETRIEGLRASLEKSQKTVEEVRTKLQEEENSRLSLQSELQIFKSSSSTSTSEVETLRARITSLEAANRDTVAVLESKTTANDELAKDLQKQHQKGLELSQQITSLQQAVQNATSAASSAKFREQSLKQEVELAKRNNEWFENELKTKSAEALKYRKEKGTRISELQRQNEEVNSNLEALKRTEQALRNRLEEIQQKAEESLSKVQQLQEAAATAEEGFRQELESSRRLADLQTQQTETHRNRLKEVEAALEKAKDDAAEEVGRCRQEAEAERQDREQAEHRIAELEAEVDRLEALVAAPRPGSVPGTPRQGLNGSLLGISGSPTQFGTPGSVRSKSAITATQAIEELYKVKGKLATATRKNEELTANMAEMLDTLEAKQPEIEELHAEHDRLQQEVVEMSKFVDQTGKERDRAKKDARKAESELSTAKAEANILRQQLRDLSAQIKLLLFDLDARERGLEALDPAERAQLERLARGEVSEDALEGMTDTDRLISQRLTVFRSISELQEKNQELLKITRQLGAQMESGEALAAKHQAMKDHEEVQTLQSKIENYKDELQSMITRSESYIKERDMFRRMLQHRGQLPPSSDLASVFGQSVDGNQNGLMQTIEQGGNRDNANYAVLLRELQTHFDQYREEQTVDRRTLKEQAEKLSIEKGQLHTEVAKVTSQLTLINERHEMLTANYALLEKENTELKKRSQVLSESSAKQDMRTQQVAEDLVEAKGLLESMRNENANLKAEKKLWKDIQDRLNQDNEGLMNERTRLNNLVANQQTLQNERELADSETRRRLQAQVESLEAELSTTKRKLNDEIEDSKKAQLRKEYDSQQNQKRIDDLASTLSQAREELVAAKTTRDHLQARERVELLQPRPTPRPGTNGQTAGSANEALPEGELTREQELAIEVSELKRDLDLQMEQYKSINQYHAKIRELQQRQSEVARQISRLKDEDERHATAAQFHQQDLRAQAAIATKAQQDYENELELRAEHNQLKTQATLSQNESSWEERRQHFEQELKELRTRRDDLNAQNKLLHQQLEGVGAQVAALQQSQSSNDRAADGLLQYDLKLDYAQSQLDESRLKLDQERRLHADGGRNSVAHKDLMEKLNELNLMRESTQTQLAEKSKRVDELMEQIEPLETKIREFEHGKETMEGEMRLLQEDRDRWQKRTQDIMSKYDRVDPAEMEQLKESLESLRAEQKLQTKLIEQAKEKSRVQSKEIKDKTTERDSALQEKETLQEQLSGLQQQLQIAVRDKEAAEQQLAVLNQELENVKSERDRALASVSQAPDQAPATPASQRANSLDQELREQLEKSNSERDTAIAEAAAAQSRQTTLSSDTTMQNGNEEGQIDEAPSRAEAKFKEQEEKARRIEEHMKDQLNKRLVQAKETQKAELEAEYKLKLDQEKQIWLAESKSAAPPLNVKPPQGSPSLSTLSDKDIFRGNLTKRVTVETQKLKDENQKLKDEAQTLKDEHAKVLAEVQQKAEAQKVQSVMMETKKSALKLNMSDNKARLATGKLEIVEKAAQETPQKPVVEVWEEVKTYKLPPAATASSEPTSQSNGTSAAVSKPLEVKTEAPSNGPPQAAQAQPSSTPALSNGTPAAASSNIPVPSQPGNPAQRVSSLPTMRGSTTLRGRGGAQVYQARGGGQVGQGGRGRGGPSQRGGLNASATPYSPTGPAGIKRAREEGSIGGPQQANAGKRPRGGGPN